MNSNPNLDLHPDAESLNAFAEQALGAGTRSRFWRILQSAAGAGR